MQVARCLADVEEGDDGLLEEEDGDFDPVPHEVRRAELLDHGGVPLGVVSGCCSCGRDGLTATMPSTTVPSPKMMELTTIM